MATQSVSKSREGPIWPLGAIAVPTPGTPVSIMSLVDAAKVNAPETQDQPGSPTAGQWEYTPRAWKILIQSGKATTHGIAVNTGNIYILIPGVQGAGNRDDYGAMIAYLPPSAATGQPSQLVLDTAALNRNIYSPYQIFIDADTAADGALVTLFIA